MAPAAPTQHSAVVAAAVARGTTPPAKAAAATAAATAMMPRTPCHARPHADALPPSTVPPPHLAVVSALLNDFWRHPVGRADERVALGHGVGELRRHAKVRQLDLRRQGGAEAETGWGRGGGCAGCAGQPASGAGGAGQEGPGAGCGGGVRRLLWRAVITAPARPLSAGCCRTLCHGAPCPGCAGRRGPACRQAAAGACGQAATRSATLLCMM